LEFYFCKFRISWKGELEGEFDREVDMDWEGELERNLGKWFLKFYRMLLAGRPHIII